MFKNFTPSILFALWIIGVIVADIIALNSDGVSGFYFFIGSLFYMAAGIFVLCIITSILFFTWFKKTWYIIVPVFIFSGMYIFIR
jgi:hypothetical protein